MLHELCSGQGRLPLPWGGTAGGQDSGEGGGDVCVALCDRRHWPVCSRAQSVLSLPALFTAFPLGATEGIKLKKGLATETPSSSLFF